MHVGLKERALNGDKELLIILKHHAGRQRGQGRRGAMNHVSGREDKRECAFTSEKTSALKSLMFNILR